VLNNLLITGKKQFLQTGYRLWKKSGFNITDSNHSASNPEVTNNQPQQSQKNKPPWAVKLS